MTSFDQTVIKDEKTRKFMMRAILLVEPEQDQNPVWIGHVDNGLPKAAEIIVRKITDEGTRKGVYCLGLKILLRCEPTLSSGGELSNYIEMSVIANPNSCILSHRKATAADKVWVAQVAPSRELGRLFLSQESYRVRLTVTGEDAFFYKPAEAPLHTSNPYVVKAYKALQSINKAKIVWIFLHEDKKLVSHLNSIVENKYGQLVHMTWFTYWKYPLPGWMSNQQRQMAAGMADMVNEIFYQSKLIYGPRTSVKHRPLAHKFAEFIANSYPELGGQPRERALPIFLNVTDSLRGENEDGTSHNTASVSVGIDIIRRILITPEIDKNVHIGVVAMYPGQAKAYKDYLSTMHPQDLQEANSKVTVLSRNSLPQREPMEFVIVDVAQTGRVENSVDDMVKSTQLREALTIHRDGLIVIGRLPATLDRFSRSKVADENIGKFWRVCEWFSGHNRVVDVCTEHSLASPSRPFQTQVGRTTGGESPAFTSNVPNVKRKADTDGHSEREIRAKKVPKVSHITDEVERFFESLTPKIQPPPASSTLPNTKVSLPAVEGLNDTRFFREMRTKRKGSVGREGRH